MKKAFTFLLFLSITILTANSDLKKDFVLGDPGIASINALEFGPESILFIGDSQNAMIYAVDLSSQPTVNNENINIPSVDEKLAELLGTTVDELQINDMVVDPATRNIYFGVTHSSGTPVLFKVVGNSFEPVSLNPVSFSKAKVSKAVSEESKDRRGRSLRQWAVSDLGFQDGSVLVSGLSNAEFSSTFSKIPFPFKGVQEYASLEIYHAAHGQYETQSPIKAFLPTMIDGESKLIAGYTCTPLVVFPMNSLISGEHIKGRTVAELGNWNTPLDIIEMEKEDQRYILIANSSRALMKFSMNDIINFEGSLTEPVAESSGTDGVKFINLPFVNVQQLAKLDDQNFLMLQRLDNGDLALKTGGNRWL